MTIHQIEKVYDRYSRIYDLLFGWVFANGREVGQQLLELYPGAQVLEVGVGTGLSLPRFSLGVDISGIDLSQDMLSQAQKRLESWRMRNVKLLRMDAAKLNFPENSFDRVYAAYFISTVPDPIKVVQEMKRVCRPGGYLIFLNHFQSENPLVAAVEKLVSPFCKKLGFRTDLNLDWLMRKTGLKVETLERTDFLDYWRAVRCINPPKMTTC
ncbi:MAG: methyltransferase domain-containing protein [Verrucomicrobiales bacterium]|nr:methyltransferase domain-containing protein [Verrucomicrobiales bacterium]